jgi:hypothetical protein
MPGRTAWKTRPEPLTTRRGQEAINLAARVAAAALPVAAEAPWGDLLVEAAEAALRTSQAVQRGRAACAVGAPEADRARLEQHAFRSALELATAALVALALLPKED